MDVKTCTGRVVSILNSTSSSTSEQEQTQQQSQQYRPRQYARPHLAQSRRSSSSSNSMSVASPHTPALSRTDSDDSRAALSPSPITPTLAYETQFARFPPQTKAVSTTTQHDTCYNTLPRPTIVHHNSGYRHPASLQTHSYDPAYPTTPSAAMGSLSLHTPTELCKPSYPQALQQQQQSPRQQLSQTSSSSSSKPATKKNSYPCPVARQYACNEYFTTSGHAARHAKKHTGRKDAICPECSKAFTRKDNMEQHRRTHSGVRGAARSAASLEDTKTKKVKLQERRAQSPAESSSSPEVEMLDPRLIDAASTTQQEQRQQQHLSNLASLLSAQQHLNDNANTLPPLSSNAAMRPHMHRSSAKDSLQWILSPATTSSPTSQYRPSYASPSHAPALDALALAASRQ